jgi:serine phosphatase RsbU (regulator of sigma subunit)
MVHFVALAMIPLLLWLQDKPRPALALFFIMWIPALIGPFLGMAHLRLDQKGVRVRSFYDTFSLNYGQIVGLSRGGQSRIIVNVEMDSGVLFSFRLFTPFYVSGHLNAVLDQLSRRTNCSWQVLDYNVPLDPYPDFRQYFSADQRNFKGWLIRRLFMMRSELLPLLDRRYRLLHYAVSSIIFIAPVSVVLFQGSAFKISPLAIPLTVGILLFLLLVNRAVNFAMQLAYIDKRRGERLVEELSAAGRVQENLLPKQLPDPYGYELAAACQPALQVGGDYFDAFLLPGNRLCLVVADVSGKGLPAGLLMTMTKGFLRMAFEDSFDVAQVVSKVNTQLVLAGQKGSFISMVVGVLDCSERRITMVRAGHNPPLFRSARSSKTSWIKSKGIALGLTKDALFENMLQVKTLEFDRRDLLLLYSDGVTEAFNAEGKEYGDDRLHAFVQANHYLDATSFKRKLLEDVASFRGDAEISDDLTFVVIRGN